MKTDERNLIWLDLEMTGLSPEENRILEIATVITDGELNVLAEGPVLVIGQNEEMLQRMSKTVRLMHTKSGLLEQVKHSVVTEMQAEDQTLEFIKSYVPPGKSPLCGNSICMDRRFMARWMPKLEAYFHYRHIDVSTLKELASRWAPSICANIKKENNHRALADVYESIQELKHYREHWMNDATNIKS